ncbi:MAG: pyridoxamine 5'-phosphate oxidase family protein [Pseudomonadota bacterium]
MSEIDTLQKLDAQFGPVPSAMQLKEIDHIDERAAEWIAASSLVFSTLVGESGLSISVAGGDAGFVTSSKQYLHLPCDSLDHPELVQPGVSFGSLFFVAGINETLRVNGTIESVAEAVAKIRVDVCFGHCAKALIRSDFWLPQETRHTALDQQEFIESVRFFALATCNSDGEADLSPKGDPAGKTVIFHDGNLYFADRPGNRRMDSFRNLLSQDYLQLLTLIPGSSQIALVKGRAQLATDAAQLAMFEVNGKLPKLVCCIPACEIELYPSKAIRQSSLWPVAGGSSHINPARLFVEHIRLNKQKGMAAKVARVAVGVPGLMQKQLDKDYEDNLY